MSGITYTWIGAPGTPSWGDDAADWSPGGGPPGPGDNGVLDNGGQLNLTSIGDAGTTVFLDNGTLNFPGDDLISASNPSVGATAVITTANGPGVSLGSNVGVIDSSGNFVNEGTIDATGNFGSSLTINIAASGSTPGYFYNDGTLEADSGDTLTINVGANSALVNNSEIISNGGDVVIDVNASAIAGGAAPVNGYYVIEDGGTLETNAGYSSSDTGTAPVYSFADSTSGNTLKIDNLATFGGRINGFGVDDTIDLGTSFATASKVAFNNATGVLNLETSTGTVLASLRLVGGDYVNSSFTIGTGSDGFTTLTTSTVLPVSDTTGVWQSAGVWSNDVVPSSTSGVRIGEGATSPFTLTTGASPVTVAGVSIISADAAVQVTSGANVTGSGVGVSAGSLEVTAGNTLTTTSVAVSGTGLVTVDSASTLSISGLQQQNLGNVADILSPKSGATPTAGFIGSNGTLQVDGSVLAGGSILSVQQGGTLAFGAGGNISGNVILYGGTISGTMTVSGNDDTFYVSAPPLDQDATAAGQIGPAFDDTISGNLVATGTDDSILVEIPPTTGQSGAQTLVYGPDASGPNYGFSGFATVTVTNGDTLILEGANSATQIVVQPGSANPLAASTLQIGDGGTVGSISSSTNVQVKNHATLSVDLSTSFSYGGHITGSGSFVQLGTGTTTLSNTSNTFSGGVTIDAGTLDLVHTGSAGGGAITFAGAAELKLDNPTLPANTINGFATGDTIDLTSIQYTNGQPTLNGSDVLSFTEGGTPYTLNFDSSVTGDTFVAKSDNASGTLIELQAACYLAGTRIATPRGDVAIEDLAVGDFALTANGEARPIRWLGWRALKGSRHPHPELVLPVRVAAHAFGEELPQRDLWLSPGHNIAVDGVLMPISALVNGISVAQTDADSVVYWHLELDSHDVVLAEGLPAESYLDCGNRAAFANGGDFVEAHPDFLPRDWRETCLPLVKEGPQVEAVKARLLARLVAEGHELTAEADAHILADGARVEPIHLGPTRLGFALPAGARALELRSRVFTPSQTSAASMDPRRLGLEVARLQVDGEEWPLGAEAFALSGWCEAEFVDGRFNARWTGGAAELPADARLVIVDLAGHGLYWRSTVAPAVPNFRAAFDLSDAEQVGESFLLGAQTASDDWRIYEQANANEPIGILVAEDSAAAFLEKVYRFLLGREADESGLRAYERALTAGELERRDVIRELLASEEGRRHGARLVIVCAPERSLAA